MDEKTKSFVESLYNYVTLQWALIEKYDKLFENSGLYSDEHGQILYMYLIL
jgi:hypothetical protein